MDATEDTYVRARERFQSGGMRQRKGRAWVPSWEFGAVVVAQRRGRQVDCRETVVIAPSALNW